MLKVISLDYTPLTAEMTTLLDLLQQLNRLKSITLSLNKETFKEWEPFLIQLLESNSLPSLRYLKVRLLSFNLGTFCCLLSVISSLYRQIASHYIFFPLFKIEISFVSNE
jgi:hypothetical protein